MDQLPINLLKYQLLIELIVQLVSTRNYQSIINWVFQLPIT